MKRLLRHRAFLLSILREGNRNKRHDLIQHPNGEQINAVSELVLNMLKNKLRRHKKVLKELGRRKNSIKKRRLHLMNQKGSGFWQGLHEAYCNCFQS